ncbi:MAG: hypothetical protein II458_00420 [Oscillospiraceae bacterium]|nr:hypothetical protein [Oscillospiraceae bacterium]
MINTILNLLKIVLFTAPFVLFALLNGKANLKKDIRSRQLPMPILALIYCIVLMLLISRVSEWILMLINWLPSSLTALAQKVSALLGGRLPMISSAILALAHAIEKLIASANLTFILFFIVNAVIMLVHVILKRILITFMKGIFKKGGGLYDKLAGIFYEHDTEKDAWFVQPRFAQGRTFLKTLYWVGLCLAELAVVVSAWLYSKQLLAVPFYPVFGVIILGELYFCLDGVTKKEAEGSLTGEQDESKSSVNYSLLRQGLRKLFGDKLVTEDTTVSDTLAETGSADEAIDDLLESDKGAEEAYGVFIQKKLLSGMKLDENYIASGRDLLNGKSILFNNPFYYDLIPYAFYAMNRTLLRQKKVLIVLGRHGTEDDIISWCGEGLRSVTNIQDMWRIGVLTKEETDLNVGVLTRSSVHDQKLLEANADFFRDVYFVVLVEPSRLITTAQIGLNSLLRLCRCEQKAITFCSTDKNCDGLVDALSHILMTSISEVSATNRHEGACSYMCWETDREHLQHRMLPNLSRYLGMGTELSFAALKNQVSQTAWYGGDAFPVVDIRWIAKQYYYDLLHYADLPTSQEFMDKVFEVSPNLWNMKKQENCYLTVEDESRNMFEIKRDFSTRSTSQSFINVISPEYLLKDYMADNNGLFNADAKAIPYIVADYARTPRNVALRLCLRMSTGYVAEGDIRRELLLIDVDTKKLLENFWHNLCSCSQPIGTCHMDEERGELLYCADRDETLVFDISIIEAKRKFSVDTGSMETYYHISNERFKRALLENLQNASYIAEEESGEYRFLGSELQGHVFQKYLPGQFFTFSGKYYEMLSVTADGRVLVRRAADHINGRPEYRQVRHYKLHNAVDSTGMGDIRTVSGMRVCRQYADISVETPAYWKLDRYNDFETAHLDEVNGIPVRHYHNKQILKITFSEHSELATPEVRRTIVLLMNEVLRTLLAENQDYLTVLMPGEVSVPITCDLDGADGFAPDEDAIYIIEDSQLDIGLLVAVDRNLERIFSIICDYLDWHNEAMEKSLNPPLPPPPPAAEPEPEPEEKVSWLKKLFRRKKDGEKKPGFFKRLWNKLFKRKAKEAEPADGSTEAPGAETPAEESAEKPKKAGFFSRLFKRKAKEPEPADGGTKAPGTETPAEESAEKPKKAGFFSRLFKRKARGGDDAKAPSDGDSEATDSPNAPDPEETPSETSIEDAEPETETAPALDAPDFDSPDTDNHEAEFPDTEEETPSDAPSGDDASREEEGSLAFNDTTPFILYNESGGDGTALTPEAPADAAQETPADPAPEAPADAPSGGAAEPQEVPAAGKTGDDDNSYEFEPESVRQPLSNVRKPYHERYYLLYGGTEVSPQLDLENTLEYLRALGFVGGSLQQARKGQSILDLVEKNYVPNDAGRHYCDFCGRELTGTEYDVLADGRERCPNCSRTSIKTEEDFIRIFHSVVRNMEVFFGIRINAPVQVSMVNSKRLHKRLGKTFVPTSKPDGRTLGVAIHDKNGYSLLVENGAPRVSSATTMAHELTHIWQYLNWDRKAIRKRYGAAVEKEIYEGMARWVEIQYAYLIGEVAAGKRLELCTHLQKDEYGRGFLKYVAKYPLSVGTQVMKDTPFCHKDQPL